MKYSLLCFIILSFGYVASGQKTLQRPFNLINTISYGNGNILVTGVDSNRLILETYTFYGLPIATQTLQFSRLEYSQPIFWYKNRFYHILGVDSVHYQLIVMDEKLNILERNDLDHNFNFRSFDCTSLTPFDDKLYAITEGPDYKQYSIGEYTLKGQLLAKKPIAISHVSIWWNKLIPYNGAFLYNRDFSNDTLYSISMDGIKSKVPLKAAGWENNFLIKDGLLYTASCNTRRYLFCKCDLQGNILDSFSTPVPNNMEDNIGTYNKDNNFVHVKDEVFCYVNEYRENSASYESNQVAYYVDFNQQSVKPFRQLVDQRTSNLIVKIKEGDLLFAYSKNKSVINPNKVGPTKPVWNTILEFPKEPDGCAINHSPNPAETVFTISSPCLKDNSPVFVQLFDLSGRLCYASENVPYNKRIEINGKLKSGLYGCIVTIDGKQFSFKQIIL